MASDAGQFEKEMALNINESSPLQIKEENKEETKYQTLKIQYGRMQAKKKYEGEEKCLQHWLLCCTIFITSIIPIVEIIILILYFGNLLCPLQRQWTYFVLTKLIFEIITISLFIGVICGKGNIKAISIISYACLLIWNIILTIELFNDSKYLEQDIEQNCNLLIDFILFESVSCWAVILLILCIAFWWYLNEQVVSIISTIAPMMHNLVINITFTILYQWCMSIIEIVFLAIYFHDYRHCNSLYPKYILAKFVFTICIIACNIFLKYYIKQFINVLYIIALVTWCIATSVIFWGHANDIQCRTNQFTSHFFDFIMLDIVLGFVVVTTEFCRVCWMRLSDYLGQPGVIEKYGQFASSNTAEWLRYKESQKR
eukprot:176782_1